MTKVVNVKVKYIRPDFDNLKDWMKNENNEYIGRRGVVFVDKKRFPEKDSIWCNPFKIKGDKSREDVIREYEIYIRERLEKTEGLKDELLKLKGKNLGCWCKELSCHGDVLVKIINDF